jgi:hypothetical protein
MELCQTRADRKLLLDFFLAFSRFGCALKAQPFLQETG